MRLLVLALFALAGCIDGSGSATVTLDQENLGPGSGHGSVHCGDQATLDVFIGRVDAGAIELRVLDGGESVALETTYESGDQGATERSLFGARGTWELEVGGTFAGQIRAVLTC